MSETEQFRVTAEYLAQQGLSPTFPARFFSKIQFTDSCWLWTGGRLGEKYGLITRWGVADGMIYAHRASWILHFGPIPEGMSVLHDCPDGDNMACVNPAHLWLGSQSDNAKDAYYKGRNRHKPHYGESHGRAKLSWEYVQEIRNHPDISTRQYATLYGVDMSTVWRARTKRFWSKAHD